MAERMAAEPELDAALAWFVKNRRLAGAAAGVLCEDDAAWSAGAGFADLACGAMTDSATVYRIASITKTFTGTAVLQLRDAGLLDLDEPAAGYIPEMRHAAAAEAKIELMTIRRMLAHASGLASEPPGTDWTIPVYEGLAASTLRQPGAVATRIPPGQHPKYSNLAYQLLGEVITRASGTAYVDYVQEGILLPLGMNATGFDASGDGLASRRATGYAPRAFSDELDVASAAPRLWAEGGLWSCVDDLLTWVSAQLGAYRRAPSPGPVVLSAASLREMHAPRYLEGDDWTRAWGLSWCAVRQGVTVWIQHSGRLPGFSTAVCFNPESQIGAVALINGSAEAADLAMELASIAFRGARARPPRIRLPEPTPGPFRPLLGLYSRAGHSLVIRLEWRDGMLTFINPEEPWWRPTLLPTGDPCVFTVGPGYRESGERVTFRELPDGRIDEVFLADATWGRLEHVTPAEDSLA
ncbi:MAG: serine hydrolase domain-containing protein [Streptosporangiales bacterium]